MFSLRRSWLPLGSWQLPAPGNLLKSCPNVTSRQRTRHTAPVQSCHLHDTLLIWITYNVMGLYIGFVLSVGNVT